MHDDIITAAQRVAQEFGLKIIPCGARKQPLQKGWPDKATDQPTEEDFAGATFVGVPTGPVNDLVVFDLDYYKRGGDGVPQPADNETWDRLADFEEELMAAYPGQVRVHKTQSGGVHLIMRYPVGNIHIPRSLMPQMEIMKKGHQFIWPTEGSGYEVEVDVPLDELARPDAAAFKIRHVVEGMSSGGNLMSSEMADKVMRSNGSAAARHDAMLRIAHDLAKELTDENLRVMNDAQIAEAMQKYLYATYGAYIDAKRADDLFEFRADPDGTLVGGELKRALIGEKGALTLRRAQSLDRFAELMAKQVAKGEQVKKGAEDLYRQKVAGYRSLFEMAPAAEPEADDDIDEFTHIDGEELLKEQIPDIDWIVDGILPAGNLVSIAGPSGAGKTRFLSAFVAALASGETHKIGLSPAARSVKTMWCANEERVIDVKRRIKAAMVKNDITPGDYLVRGKEHGQLKLALDGALLEAPLVKLIRRVKREGVELVIFDPFVTLGVDEENSAGGVGVVVEAMQRITSETGAAVLFVHHTPKGDKNAPEDDARGSSGAWRGSGAIYSALDMGLTLHRYLPPSCHGKDGTKNRRKLMLARSSKKVAKYIVLDPAKEREGEPLTPVHYRMDTVPVREGGRGIAVLSPVHEQDAIAAIDAVLTSASDEQVDAGVARAWAAVMLETWPGEGRHKVTLQQIVKALDEAAPVGWTPSKTNEKIRDDRGSGEAAYRVLSQTTPVSGVTTYLLKEARSYLFVVSK